MNNFLGIEFDKGASKRLSFLDPGPLPEELTHVPGFIGKLADFTLATGHSPNRVLAFSGALAMLAHLTGRGFADTHGTRTNLYVVVLGDSGIGKDDPRKTNARLARHGGSLDRRGLIRSLSCDVQTLNRVIKAMIVAEEIDSPEQIDGKIIYSLRNE